MKPESFALDGFTFSALAAGIKHAAGDKPDFSLIVAENPCPAAGVFTTNVVKAAPVQLSSKRLRQHGICRGILINSGNANAVTGERGMADAMTLTAEVADHLGADEEHIIAMSTGVIGQPLPLDRMRARIPDLVSGLHAGRGEDVAKAILTTDTTPKTILLQEETSVGPFRMLGMAKGAGMIAPNMATMLAVLLTDIKVLDTVFLQQALLITSEATFNHITVDGDTSTNDSLVVLAGGGTNAKTLPGRQPDRDIFMELMHHACSDLARQVVMDGEGATKLVAIRVCGASDSDAAAQIARTIAESPLVKTAFYGEDPNWGRIICAAGRSRIAFNPNIVDLFIGKVQVLRDGLLASEDWEPAAAAVMKAQEFVITLDLKSGKGEARFLTTDFSKEYVAINADYRS